MTINSLDAADIAKVTADTFRTKVSHHRGEITTQEYMAVLELCKAILSEQTDNKDLQHKTIDPISGEVTDHVSK